MAMIAITTRSSIKVNPDLRVSTDCLFISTSLNFDLPGTDKLFFTNRPSPRPAARQSAAAVGCGIIRVLAKLAQGRLLPKGGRTSRLQQWRPGTGWRLLEPHSNR